MADDNSILFSLDLDSADFKAKMGEAANALASLSGKSKDLDALVESFKSMAEVGAVVGIAFLAVKTAISAVADAEGIKAVNAQFELLATNAGVASEKLREGLAKTSGGLIDETDLLKLANKAIVEMGASAAKLPEIMELARKATSVFGGELSQNFEMLSTAVATGNVRMLKHMGIVIDTQKATRDYAASIGASVSELTQSEQHQAILNAVLAKGRTAFQGVNTDSLQVKNTMQQLAVTFQDTKEVIALAWDRIAGPTVVAGLQRFSELVKNVSGIVRGQFGSAADKAAASIEDLNLKIQLLHEKLEAMPTKAGFFDKLLGRDPSWAIEKVQKELADLEAQRDAQTAKLNALHATEAQHAEEQKVRAEQVSNVKEKNFARSIAQLEVAVKEQELEERKTQTQMEYATTVEQVDELEEKHYQAEVGRMEESIRLINEKLQARQINEIQAGEQINQVQEQFHEQELRRISERSAAYKKLQDNEVRESKSTMDGVGRAFKGGAQVAKSQLNDFGATGKRVYSSFENNAVSALQAVGAGTKSAADAAKGFIFGMLADEAEARGKLMLLTSIWPPNPVGLVAGAGLIALSGFLRSQAGGSSSSAGGGGAPSGGDTGGGSGFAPVGVDTGQVATQQEATKKAVTIQIQGSYFETEQTRTRLMQMIREESDATDFKLVQIGQN